MLGTIAKSSVTISCFFSVQSTEERKKARKTQPNEQKHNRQKPLYYYNVLYSFAIAHSLLGVKIRGKNIKQNSAKRKPRNKKKNNTTLLPLPPLRI
jgi:hypothetical protein